jgi:5-methylcytosine-specific restriction endonuclease McrA
VLLEKLTKEKFAATDRPRKPKLAGKNENASGLNPKDSRSHYENGKSPLQEQPEGPRTGPGDLSSIAPRAKTTERHASKKESGSLRRPRPTESRYIPAEVRRTVWKRDDGQCAFVSHTGRRCTARGWLEFHHVEPYMLGGKATIENIELRCRTHNAYEGELVFGRKGTARTMETPGASSGPNSLTDMQPELAPATVVKRFTNDSDSGNGP